ncbi:MAG: hypothetical protein ACOX83_01610 [Candidatus Spyradocola sp.]
MFNALYRSILMLWRMLKNAVLRPFRSLYARARTATNLSRQASKLVPKVVKTVTTVKVKPKKREDYIDAGPVYVAKSLIFVVIGVIAAIWLLVQFLIWPWMESRWFTARMYELDAKAETYTGRVELYSDAELEHLSFAGRLEEGVKTGRGTEYYENGVISFEGTFVDGLYSGEGTLRNEDGNVLYEGGFLEGLYSGEGSLYADNALLYEGEFAQGLYEGEGKLYAGGQLVYEGDFVAGRRTGQGKAYEDGALVYEGGFQDDAYSGAGSLYYADGTLRAECATFANGMIDGACVLYYEDGQIKFEGNFSQGEASGQGTLYDETGNRTYYGGFEAGLKSGTGTEYYADGRKEYEGGFVQGQRDGEGTLYNEDGTVLYAGGFSQGLYEGTGTLNLEGGARIEGTFAAGAVTGTARYFQGETLVYEGALADGNAEGAGTLYANGAAIYVGNFSGGFLDGASLLDMAVTDLRDTVFAGTTLTESRADQGFVIDNPTLQAAVFCNYGYNDAEIVVHRVYLYGQSLSSRFAGGSFTPAEGYSDARETRETPLLLPGVVATAQTSHAVTRYDYGDYTLRVWTDAKGVIDLIEWRSTRDLATESGGSGSETDAETSMVDGLLADLGLGSASTDAGAETGTAADGTTAEDGTAAADGATTADGTTADGTTTEDDAAGQAFDGLASGGEAIVQ